MISRKNPRWSGKVSSSLKTIPSIVWLTLKSSLGKVFKISHRVYDSLHIHVIQFRIDWQRQNLAGGQFSARQLIKPDSSIFISRLEMDRDRIMNQCANAVTAQVRLQAIP